MNPSSPLLAISRLIYRIGLGSRILLPRKKCHAFGPSDSNGKQRIEKIYVINLDRQTDRWININWEISLHLDSSGSELTNRTIRYPAIDARNFALPPFKDNEVYPFYTLGDQLYVEPQPRALPDQLELNRPIRMSRQEIAVARSHIGVWREIAAGEHSYALVLEDDVWFQLGFTQHLDRAWGEIHAESNNIQQFDILYLSYKEVKHGAQKTLLSSSVFRPVRGLWYLSGYVLSREGAKKLLRLLPCRGPIDLWINHQFGALDVQATKRSIIGQRRDHDSTNAYSILPALTKIGVLDSESNSLFQNRPKEGPVFAFGDEKSGMSSLALALSMLGYRCCSDLEEIPELELEQLFAGGAERVFSAYVNVGSLKTKTRALSERYLRAKFIITTSQSKASNGGVLDILDDVSGCDVAVLHSDEPNKWKVVCEHLKCAPPVCPFPEVEDIGQRRLVDSDDDIGQVFRKDYLKRDVSPWIVEIHRDWKGLRSAITYKKSTKVGIRVSFNDSFEEIDTKRWELRDDTFSGNLALFRPANVDFRVGVGAVLSVRRELLSVRDYSAAAISSRDQFLFGRFETVLQATRVPGLVTGFFLHRNSPRQEIDIEIVGSRSDCLLVNVFYNPGDEGAPFDYGYRGSPTSIELGFDASESAHRFAIEWDPGEIRWLVDNKLVHRRVNWDPTPIPQLPMTLHVNTWPSRSKELAGRLVNRKLPATTVVGSIAVDATLAENCPGK